MGAHRWIPMAVLSALSCQAPVFVCAGAESCDGGTCQPNGYCSFDDPQCPSGQRYGDFAGDGFAGTCVTDDEVASTGEGSQTAGTTTTTSGTTTSGTTTSGTTTSDPTTSSSDVAPSQPWWDERWSHRQALSIDGTALTEDLLDVPVLVLLDAERVDVVAIAPQGGDLVFVSSDGAEVLVHEVDEWSTEGPNPVWVRVPFLRAGISNELWLYYGSDGAAPNPIAETVWDAAHVTVFHLGPIIVDAVGGGEAAASGVSTGPGWIGSGCAFDAADGVVDAGASDSSADLCAGGITVSAWINPSSFGQNLGGRIVDKADAVAPTLGFSFELQDTDGLATLQFDRGGVAEGAWQATPGAIDLDRWQHIAVTYADGDEPALYVDGVELGVVQTLEWGPPAASDAGAALLLGNDLSSTRDFEGAMDELRISSTRRSAAWIEFEYLSGADQVVSFGPIELRP